MVEPHRCPKCGAELPANAPAGVCPKCLLEAGTADSQPDAVSDLRDQETAAPRPHSPPGAAGSGPAAQDTSEPEAFDLQLEDVARLFPQLEVVELLGRGGMGLVFKARQPKLDRYVALKILPPKLSQDPSFTERFTREARALAKLGHPNVVAVYDFGENNGLYYFIMEFVDGPNLREVLLSQQLKPAEAMQIIPQVCDALQFAHDQGVVHRDIKPENILVDRQGRVKVADFGLAKLLGREPAHWQLTYSGQVMGTAHYMAPEQFEKPLEVDHRADIYSLGVTFYELLTGELPIGRFAPPSRKVHVDVRLDQVVLRALDRDLQHRYQRVGDVKTDVESIKVSAGDAPLRTPPSPGDDVEFAQLRQEVKRPAVGLLVTAILNWITLPLTAVVVSVREDLRPQEDLLILAIVAVVSMTLSAVMIVGALRMMRLEARGLGLLSSVLATIVSPGNLIGLPIGIWSMVVLTRLEVKRAFRARQGRRRASQSRPPEQRVGGPAIGLIIVAGMSQVLLAMYLLGSLVQWQDEGFEAMWADFLSLGYVVIAGMALSVPAALVMILAAIKMKNLQTRWLAITGSLLAVLSCGPLIFISLPVGIWALWVLSDREVRAAFERRRGQWPAKEESAADVERALARRLLGQAIWLVLGVLLAAAGAALLIVGLCTTSAGSDDWWKYMSGAFASGVAGVTWVVSALSRHQRLSGHCRLSDRQGWFWLDWLLVLYAWMGVMLVAGSVIALPLGRFGDFWPALGLGAIALVQAGLVLVWRSSKWRVIHEAGELGSAPTLLDRRLLTMAIGIVGSTLLFLAGAAAITVGLLSAPGTKLFWGLIAAGLGAAIGGAGSTIGLLKLHREWSLR